MNKSIQFYFSLALGLHGIVLFGITFTPPAKPPADPLPPHVEVALVDPSPVVEEPPPPAPEPEPEPLPEPVTETPPEPPPAEPLAQELPPPEPAPEPPPAANLLTVTEPVTAPADAEFVVAATTNKVVIEETPVVEPVPEPPIVRSPVVVKTQARYRKNPEPHYPLQAKRRRQEGLVLLRVLVNPNGTPTQVEVQESSGYSSLDEAAVQAVRLWEFEPTILDGQPVSSDVEVPVRFRLVK